MAFTFVTAQNNGTAGATATTLVLTVSGTFTFAWLGLTYGSAVITGGSSGHGDLASITDNGTGGTWVILDGAADSGNGQSGWTAYGYGWSSAPTTITMTLDASLAYRGMSCLTFNGQASGDPIDGTQHAIQFEATPGTGADGCDCGTTLVPSANNHLVVGFSVNTGALGGGGSELAAGTNGTEPAGAEHSVAGDISLSSEYEIQTTATNRNPAMTASVAAAHITGGAVFKVAGAAPSAEKNFLTLLGVGA